MNDKLSHQLYKTIYPIVIKLDNIGMYSAWAKFVEECIITRTRISVNGYHPYITDNPTDFIDYELRLKYDGAFYDSLIRFKSESAVTMFLLRFS
jgi:hypothetical protein